MDIIRCNNKQQLNIKCDKYWNQFSILKLKNWPVQPQQPRLHWSIGELENAELVAILIAFDVELMIVVAPDDIHEDKRAKKKV